MLYKLVEEVCSKIDQLDALASAPLLRDEILRARPDFSDRIAKVFFDVPTEGVAMTLATAASRGVLTAIKQTPALARALVQIVKDADERPALRCAVASVLCYLVQPRDLIPDDAPGGYGFVDDALVVRAGYVEYLKVLPNPKAKREDEEQLVNLLVSVTPTAVEPIVQMMIGTMALAVDLTSRLEDAVAEFMVNEMIQNPLAMTSPEKPAGFVGSAMPSYGGESWSAVAHFDGNDLIIPGGPALINGLLVLPEKGLQGW
jgi:uncharacterized membrane protein YkvA (DUF1232 family)